MKRLKELEFEVIAVAPYDKYAEKIKELNFKFFSIKNLDRKGKNPIKDFKLFLEYFGLYKKIRPDLVINFTIKPNIYSSMAAGLLKIPCLSVVTGLGYVFIKRGFIAKLVESLYRVAFRFNKFVVFQNETDFQELKNIIKDKAFIIPGSGVDTEYFSPSFCKDYPKENKKFVFLFIGRFLKDKGIIELISASERLYREGKDFFLFLLGKEDEGNPASLSKEDLENIRAYPFVKVFSFTEDVRPYLCGCDCVVLPSSYREGLPRTLLEAMAMEKPIITTDAPGCRDACEDGRNGFLVKPRDIESLYQAMKRMIELPQGEIEKMGKYGRKLIEEKYSVEKVNLKYIELIERIFGVA
jgi:glycosyltransferase involved in cell wall biosynthesis